jgi:hypothetical protein
MPYRSDFEREWPRRHGPKRWVSSDTRRRGRWREQFLGGQGRPPEREPSYREEPYSGPGELGRYGNAPVPYGSRHTYNYHFGDRFGYGPDFYVGDDRVRRRAPRRGSSPPRRRRDDHGHEPVRRPRRSR